MLEKIANSFLLVFILLAFTTPFWKPLYRPGGTDTHNASSNNKSSYCEDLTILDSDERFGYQISVETKNFDNERTKVWVPVELYKKISKDFYFNETSISNFLERDHDFDRENKYLLLKYIPKIENGIPAFFETTQDEINIAYDYSI